MATTNKLSPRQKKFCKLYVKYGNITKAAMEAGYKEKTAKSQGSRLLTKIGIREEIARINKPKEEKQIADAQEVMDFYTRAMRGEIKDQFGLDATLGDRIKAANELAKRTVDIDNRVEGKADNLIKIQFDWGDDDE